MTAAIIAMLLCMGVLATALGLALYRAVVGVLDDIARRIDDYDGDC